MVLACQGLVSVVQVKGKGGTPTTSGRIDTGDLSQGKRDHNGSDKRDDTEELISFDRVVRMVLTH